jgi:hypothetical protein
MKKNFLSKSHSPSNQPSAGFTHEALNLRTERMVLCFVVKIVAVIDESGAVVEWTLVVGNRREVKKNLFCLWESIPESRPVVFNIFLGYVPQDVISLQLCTPKVVGV